MRRARLRRSSSGRTRRMMLLIKSEHCRVAIYTSSRRSTVECTSGPGSSRGVHVVIFILLLSLCWEGQRQTNNNAVVEEAQWNAQVDLVLHEAFRDEGEAGRQLW
ncbi:hypothetical protein BDA96_06G233300 [Sorghum bicolor]|uniref:Uncharacterized protein n=1 Tax=Sorghum bicolor TaxID=4558 RepID=A0A921QVP8_SORBI|nr:hypothetical protein BDA96_06G233300 [Sorghum bicolor]